ncbi:putative oxidoreductase [Xylaria sp. FL0043]|nr:putative oxidoreductase [Xylaria sp. FL0043]
MRLGAEVQRGTLTDLELLKKAVSECDGVAHLAFVHDMEDYSGCCAIDRAAIKAIGSALAAAGGDRALVISSGTALLTKGQIGTEDQRYDASDHFGAVRGPSEQVALAFAEKGVRVSVMRLPSLYCNGGLGFVALILATVQSKGTATYLGAGDNRWPATHIVDIAQAYRLALEKRKAGSVYHAAADEGKEALENFGQMAAAMEADNPSSSVKTRKQLGWNPVQPSLLEYLESEACLEGQAALPSWSQRA